MRTSLNSIKTIDNYLSGKMENGDALVFTVNMLLNNDLKNEVQHQQDVYAIVQHFGRKNIREEIATAQSLFINAPQHRGMMQRIACMFRNHN